MTSIESVIITAHLLQAAMPQAAPERVDLFAAPLAQTTLLYGISTPLRVAHFLAQIAVESGYLRYTEELGTGHAYEGRKDLGNTQTGDGPRFKGRGLLQLTGRANYIAFSRSAGRDFTTDAGAKRIATDPSLATASAAWFWTEHHLNSLADSDDIHAITRIINGGLNGLEQRERALAQAKRALSPTS